MLQLTSTDNTEPLPILENLFRALEPGLPVIFGLMGAFALFYTIRKIHKSQMNIEDSITWIAYNIMFLVLLGLLIFPWGRNFLQRLGDAFGLNSPVVLIIALVAIFSYLKLLSTSVKLSKTNEKLKRTIQEFASFKHDAKERDNEVRKQLEDDDK